LIVVFLIVFELPGPFGKLMSVVAGNATLPLTIRRTRFQLYVFVEVGDRICKVRCTEVCAASQIIGDGKIRLLFDGLVQEKDGAFRLSSLRSFRSLLQELIDILGSGWLTVIEENDSQDR
jgi:hypothetical protein